MINKNILESPSLLGYGTDGVPAEFRQYISSYDDKLRMARGEPPHTGPAIFRISAVNALALKLLREIKRQRKAKDPSPSQSKSSKLKLTHHAASMSYMLHAYCSYWKKPAPIQLLRLTFEALGLEEGSPSSELDQIVGLPVAKNKRAWLLAAELDGEAIAQGKTLSEIELEEETKVSAKTLRRWRSTRQYQNRRDFCARNFGKLV